MHHIIPAMFPLEALYIPSGMLLLKIVIELTCSLHEGFCLNFTSMTKLLKYYPLSFTLAFPALFFLLALSATVHYIIYLLVNYLTLPTKLKSRDLVGFVHY